LLGTCSNAESFQEHLYVLTNEDSGHWKQAYFLTVNDEMNVNALESPKITHSALVGFTAIRADFVSPAACQ